MTVEQMELPEVKPEAEKPKVKPVFNTLPSKSITNDKGNTVEHISVSGLSQPPEVSRKVQEILKKHGGYNDEAKKEIAEYHAELKANPPADPVAPAPQIDEMRRYLLAIAAVVSGQFEHLTHDRLIDIAALSTGPVRDFDSWRTVAQLMRKPPA